MGYEFNPFSGTLDKAGLSQTAADALYLTEVQADLRYPQLDLSGNFNIMGTITGASLIKSGGTSSQFLKANGSVDSSTYQTQTQTDALYLALTGGTLTGDLTLNGLFGINQTPANQRLSVNQGHLRFNTLAKPIACTATNSGTAGVVDAGAHKYSIVYATTYGETGDGTPTSAITADGSHKVDLTNIPVGSSAVTSKKIYRTAVTGDSPGYWFYLVATITNATTTYADNETDASLLVKADRFWSYAKSNTTAGTIYKDSNVAISIGSNTSVGESALRIITGFNNNAFGNSALYSAAAAYQNNAFGNASLQSLTTGHGNLAFGEQSLYTITTQSNNIGIGSSVMYSATCNFGTGIGLTALFNATGDGNSAVGGYSGRTITSGTYNSFLGYSAGYHASQKVDATNSTAIGNSSYTTASNQIVLGNSSVTSVITAGTISTTLAGTNKWSLNGLTTATAVLDAAKYLNVIVDGVSYKLALIT